MATETTATRNTDNALTVTTPSDLEIVMTRVFNAPRALVFDAWTRPEHLVHWFGPRGYTMPVCEVDLRPGGVWRFIMRGPDGAEMGMKGVYREIAAPERLVNTETFDDWPDSESIVTMTLEEQEGRTTMISTSLYESLEARDALLDSGMEVGAGETLDRLEEHLGTMA